MTGRSCTRDGGREYFFGVLAIGRDGTPTYWRRWAYSDRDERAAFEAAVDLISEAWAKQPSMHVYHYAPYEPATIKRLMGRHSTREAEVDRMLRAELFVDLHAVVKHSLRASVENYSIKDLEVFCSFARTVPLEVARTPQPAFTPRRGEITARGLPGRRQRRYARGHPMARSRAVGP